MIDIKLRKTIRSTVPLLGGMAIGVISVLAGGTSAKAPDIIAGLDYVATIP